MIGHRAMYPVCSVASRCWVSQNALGTRRIALHYKRMEVMKMASPLEHPLPLSLSPSPPLSLSSSLPVSLCPSLCISPSVSLPLYVSPSLGVSISPSVCLSLSPSFPFPSIPLSPLSLSLSFVALLSLRLKGGGCVLSQDQVFPSCPPPPSPPHPHPHTGPPRGQETPPLHVHVSGGGGPLSCTPNRPALPHPPPHQLSGGV